MVHDVLLYIVSISAGLNQKRHISDSEYQIKVLSNSNISKSVIILLRFSEMTI